MAQPRPPRQAERPRRFSARRAIALWIGISLVFWIFIAAIAARFAGGSSGLDAEADRLSKIKPAAGGGASPGGSPQDKGAP